MYCNKAKKPNKTIIKNWLMLFSVLTLSILISTVLVYSSLLDINNLLELGNDLLYSLISTSATIAGFLFTGVSILISAVEKESIKRLWDNHYLDNMYRAAHIGVFSNISTIVISFALLCLEIPAKVLPHILRVNLICVLVGIIFFVWCAAQLIFVLNKMKSNRKQT